MRSGGCALWALATGGSLIITVFWVTPKPFPALHACPTGDIGAHSTAQKITVLVHYDSQFKNLKKSSLLAEPRQPHAERTTASGLRAQPAPLVEADKFIEAAPERRCSPVLTAIVEGEVGPLRIVSASAPLVEWQQLAAQRHTDGRLVTLGQLLAC